MEIPVRAFPHATRAAALPAVLIALALAAAACGGKSEATPAGAVAPPGARAVPAGATAGGDAGTWPLTGLPVASGQSAAQHHPVMVLKMDNTAASSPQFGLGEADLVVEELVEGGLTRLAAFFYSDIPGDVGPVRSMRASDIGIVSPVGATMVTSGAAPVTISRIRQAGIRFFPEGSKGFYRDGDRAAPYNLFTDLRQTATEAHQADARPADYLPWGGDADFPQGPAARSIAATFSGGHTTNWVYRGGHYVNQNTYAADGDQFPADTVLALRVKVGDAGYRDPAGNPVPETEMVGGGDAMVFHDGRVVRATWSKQDLGSPIVLAIDGKPLSVPAGHTWIELVPDSGGSVTYRR